MNRVFCAMLLIGVLAAAATGRIDGAQQALFSGGAEAVDFCLSMAGAYAFFGGLLGVLRESGVTDALARGLRRPLSRLFRFEPGEEKALDDICVNLAAELLGMGGAATPAGLSAMRKMARAGGRGRLSDAMALFLVLNMCSVQLLPTTMIAIRAQAGAKNPADITLPTLISTAVAGLTGIVLCKIFASRSKNHA
ncbi:MAG: spore maturation protein [Clostridia bacterium]|nr:spore maturation protein [Clostridia bacterium]